MSLLEKINKCINKKSYSKIGNRVESGKMIVTSKFYIDKDGNIEYIIGSRPEPKSHATYEYIGIKNKNNEYPIELYPNIPNNKKRHKNYGRRMLLYHEKNDSNESHILYFLLVSNDLETNYLKLRCALDAGQTVAMSVYD